MAKRGPKGPTKYDKEFHPSDFMEQSRKGKNITQISAEWDIYRDTLYEWGKKHKEFSDALKNGKLLCEAWYTNLGMAAMVGQAKVDGKPINFNLGAFVWMTKNVLKWSDKVENQIEHSGEVKSGTDRETELKRIFKDTKSRTLARELAEHLCTTDKKKEDDNGKD